MLSTWTIIIGTIACVAMFLTSAYLLGKVVFKTDEKKNEKDGNRLLVGVVLLFFSGGILGLTIDDKNERKNIIDCMEGNKHCPYEKVVKYESKENGEPIPTDTIYRLK